MNKRVLIIDDDAELCEELQEILQAEGFQVRTASSGMAGFQLLQGTLWDMVILDLKLPGMAGVEILKKIKKEEVSPRVIILSGRPLGGRMALTMEDYLEDEAILSMADVVFNKPVPIEILLEKVKQLGA